MATGLNSFISSNMARTTDLPFYHPEEPFFLYHDLYPTRQVKLWLDISTHCNAKCPQCHRTDANGLGKADWLPVVQWSFKQFKFAFPPKTLRMFKEIQICGTWGDPMMNKDIYEIIEYVMDNSHGIHVLINTNGSIRDEEWWWKFGTKVRGRVTVFWAVEGITHDQHSFYRQNTDLDKVLRNMESFSAAGGISDVFTVVFKHNERDMHKIAKISKDHGARHIMFVQSNRYYKHLKFDFVDEQGTTQTLYKASLPQNKDFYWKSWDLDDPIAMEIIENETNRTQ